MKKKCSQSITVKIDDDFRVKLEEMANRKGQTLNQYMKYWVCTGFAIDRDSTE